MPFVGFHELFPEIAPSETRTITLRQPSSGLPADEYAFFEMYCNEPRCDCRRVFFYVVSNRQQDALAVIAYGWDTAEYYARWLLDDDPAMIDEMKGPVLNSMSPQSSLAPALLELYQRILLPDSAYIDRIKRHYAMFREKIDGAGRPAKRGDKGKRRRKT